jgi:superfamily II DNA helicase RecQ
MKGLSINILPVFLILRGNEFRTDYSQLGMLGAFFPNAVMIALTATANGIDRVKIKDSLIMKNPIEVIASPNRSNVFYSKVLRESDEVTSYEHIYSGQLLKG